MVGELYLSLVSRHPWRVWGIQSALTMGFADFLCQYFFERKCGLADLDAIRIMRFAGMGLFYTGPGVRTWYLLLDRLVPSKGSMAVASKVALDQGLFAPVFTGVFMILTALVQQQSWDRVEAKLRTDYFDVMRTNWIVWPAVQAFNFAFVPLQHRNVPVNFTLAAIFPYLIWLCDKPCISCPFEMPTTATMQYSVRYVCPCSEKVVMCVPRVPRCSVVLPPTKVYGGEFIETENNKIVNWNNELFRDKKDKIQEFLCQYLLSEDEAQLECIKPLDPEVTVCKCLDYIVNDEKDLICPVCDKKHKEDVGTFKKGPLKIVCDCGCQNKKDEEVETADESVKPKKPIVVPSKPEKPRSNIIVTKTVTKDIHRRHDMPIVDMSVYPCESDVEVCPDKDDHSQTPHTEKHITRSDKHEHSERIDTFEKSDKSDVEQGQTNDTFEKSDKSDVEQGQTNDKADVKLPLTPDKADERTTRSQVGPDCSHNKCSYHKRKKLQEEEEEPEIICLRKEPRKPICEVKDESTCKDPRYVQTGKKYKTCHTSPVEEEELHEKRRRRHRHHREHKNCRVCNYIGKKMDKLVGHDVESHDESCQVRKRHPKTDAKHSKADAKQEVTDEEIKEFCTCNRRRGFTRSVYDVFYKQREPH